MRRVKVLVFLLVVVVVFFVLVPKVKMVVVVDVGGDDGYDEVKLRTTVQGEKLQRVIKKL